MSDCPRRQRFASAACLPGMTACDVLCRRTLNLRTLLVEDLVGISRDGAGMSGVVYWWIGWAIGALRHVTISERLVQARERIGCVPVLRCVS